MFKGILNMYLLFELKALLSKNFAENVKITHLILKIDL